MALADMLERQLDGRAQAELATAVGVAQTTISGWLRGSHLPPSTRLPALAKALGVDLEELRAQVSRERAERAAQALEANVRRHEEADAAMAKQLVEEQAKAAAEDAALCAPRGES